uniref:transglycosylase SLT domain-containing protein n=1 Tax=Nocardia anaemiae TaxID=263910 RepID=UPI000ACF6E94
GQIVTGSNANANATANAINRLTNQYLYNIAGKKYSGGTTTGQMPGGTVGDWIQQALQVLQQMGYDISKIDPQAIAIIIQHESGGNPNATNNWDSNAAKGTPSIGLMQTIGPTFNSYAAPGHTNIYNPVDNIVAGVRYSISRYGSVSNVPGVKAVRAGRPYEPY